MVGGRRPLRVLLWLLVGLAVVTNLVTYSFLVKPHPEGGYEVGVVLEGGERGGMAVE